MSAKVDIGDRLISRIRRNGTCWEYAGKLNQTGYGAVRFGGRTISTHRMAFALAGGVLTPGMHLDHVCRNRACFRPSHLELVTPGENVRRQPRIANRTTCINGHELRGTNGYLTPDGYVRCRECRRAAGRRYDARRRSHANT